MVSQARRRVPSMSFVVADVTRDRPAIGRFDLVTTFRFLGNAQDELRAAALSTIRELLQDDGYLIFNNHRSPNSLLALAGRLGGNPPGMDLTHGKLRDLLARAGFRIVTSRAVGAWIFRYKLTSRRLLESGTARTLDAMFGSSAFVPLAGDALIVARKA
jgi:hypothetical protein